jgi:aminopeptidase-like protein
MATDLMEPDTSQLSLEMYSLISKLYPICRSITGNGVRETLAILQHYIPLEVHEVPTGTQVFDWTVPKEWNVRDAYVKNHRGEKVIDFQISNLHLVSYSSPIHRTMPLSELKEHLFTLPDHPDWIPLRTSYFKETWGFSLSHNTLQTLEDGDYEVYIDSSLEDGHLTYGEYYLPGDTKDEVLFSCHICHPSLCNDNLSGIALATFLANQLRVVPRRYSYRFLFIPTTIGAITWLALNENRVDHIKHGLVIAGVGDSGPLNYKKSRLGDAEIDQIVTHILELSDQPYSIEEFYPYGYDERQYSSPGFNLAVGCLSRTPFGKYPEYHTSADNLEFVKPEYLEDSFRVYLEVIEILENNKKYVSTNSKCEPQLGRRGLYTTFVGKEYAQLKQQAMMWVLNFSDGQHSLLDISKKSKIKFQFIHDIAQELYKYNLLKLR